MAPTNASDMVGKLDRPSFITNLGPGASGLGKLIGNLLSLFYIVTLFALLLMLLIASFNWITSQGDKEKVAKARATIINAIIGMVVVGIAFVLTNMIILPTLGFNKLAP